MAKDSLLYSPDMKAPTHLQGSKSQHLDMDRADPTWTMQAWSMPGYPLGSLWLL